LPYGGKRCCRSTTPCMPRGRPSRIQRAHSIAAASGVTASDDCRRSDGDKSAKKMLESILSASSKRKVIVMGFVSGMMAMVPE
jgi:hypothetical protein